MTLLVLSIVVMLGYAFAKAANVTVRSAHHGRHALARETALDSGLAYAAALLAEDGRETFDALTDPWAADDLSVEVNGISLEIRIVDEDRKLNVNRAVVGPVDPEKTADLRAPLERLVVAAGGLASDARAIIAWIDPNTPGLHDDVAPKKPIFSAEALVAIPDLGRAVFVSPDGGPVIDDLLATHPPAINVNTASEHVLNALWSDGVLTEKILQQRRVRPFHRTSDMLTFLKTSLEADVVEKHKAHLGVRSDYFTIIVRAPQEPYDNMLTALARRTGEDVRVLSVRRVSEETEK